MHTCMATIKALAIVNSSYAVTSAITLGCHHHAWLLLSCLTVTITDLLAEI